MRKINNELKKIFTNIDGKILCIGIYEENLLNEIKNNNKIIDCDILTSRNSTSKGGTSKTKQINIKNIRKKIKTADYIIGNMEELIQFKKIFIKDSIYIGKKNIYLYFPKDLSYQEIIEKYNRYYVSIKIINCHDGTILDIDATKAKKNKIKDFFYLIYDYLNEIYNIIGEILGS